MTLFRQDPGLAAVLFHRRTKDTPTTTKAANSRVAQVTTVHSRVRERFVTVMAALTVGARCRELRHLLISNYHNTAGFPSDKEASYTMFSMDAKNGRLSNEI